MDYVPWKYEEYRKRYNMMQYVTQYVSLYVTPYVMPCVTKDVSPYVTHVFHNITFWHFSFKGGNRDFKYPWWIGYLGRWARLKKKNVNIPTVCFLGCPLLESGRASTFRPPFFFVFWRPLLESGWFFSHIHFFCVWACPFLEKKVFYLICPLRVHFFFSFENAHFCDIWKSGRFFLSTHSPPTFFFCRPPSPIS